MKTIKSNLALIIGIIIAIIILVVAYSYFSSKKATPALVSCAIGDRYDIMTGKPCPILIEEEEPATTTQAEQGNG